MNSINTLSCNKLDDTLKKYKTEKGEAITHTRIGNRELNIFGGSYNITDDIDLNDSEFYKEYYNKVFKNKKNEYLTECQLIEDGPLLVDIDLRYDKQTTERQHTDTHIIDLIILYSEKLSEIYEFNDNDNIDVYILHKPSIVKNKDITKDGIHLIFTIKIHKAIQVIIRENILNDIKNMWQDLNITNNFDEVFDIGVTKGFVNWQLFGSQKPNNDKYQITHYYTLSYDKDANFWNTKQHNINNINIQDHFPKLCARYNKHPDFPIKKNDWLNEKIEKEKTQIKSKDTKLMKNTTIISNTISSNTIIDYDYYDYRWLNHENWTNFQNHITTNEDIGYELKEIYNFVMILPETYYNSGSYNNWIRVGWALKNTKLSLKLNNDFIFAIWINFSSQSSTFDYTDVDNYYALWKGFDHNNSEGLTNRSIMYWAKNENLTKYKEIRKEMISYYIEQTIFKPTECALAEVLYQLFKNQFVCVSVKNNIWYECKHGRWFENDSGNTLRLLISKKMHDIYFKKVSDIVDDVLRLENQGENSDTMKARGKRIGEICTHLKTTSWKNNIMKEAKELFYDKDFINKLDYNPYLLAFNNYIIDFKTKKYRVPKPDDYISKCTNINYIPMSEINNSSEKAKQYNLIKDEINQFMDSLFPDENLKRYMWEHLASVLIGTNQNQSFNIYTGSGCNGKSKLIELMSKILGDYKATIPITLITQSRSCIGSASPEIAQLIGIRYAVMQEPQKGDKINEGIMKEITGGDPIQGRALFKDTITFIPQFKLVVCTNVLFDIKSNDDGTWRRIRVCDFKSKFVDDPYKDPYKFPRENFPHQFKIDRNIDEKFIEWAPVFCSMLVDIVFKTNGLVKDCAIVMAVSDKYREGQDYLTEFAKEKICKKIGGKIKKTEIIEEFKNWYIIHYGRNTVPNGREITEFMDKTYGKINKGKWINVEIMYDDYDEFNDSE